MVSMASLARSNLQQGKRGLNRLRLGLPAMLFLTSQRRACTLDDISAKGARIRLTEPLAIGRSVELRFHQLKVFASVVWVRGDQCGLHFEEPLALEDMEGFLWIAKNPKRYREVCMASGEIDWMSQFQT
jgi:PilZ domain